MSREYSSTKIEKRDQEQENESGLLDISQLIDDAFKGLLRYWVLFLAILSLCSSLFYFMAKWSYEPQYYADTTFIVNTTTALNYSESYYNKTAAEQMAKTFPYIIMNNTLKHMIEEDLGVSPIPGQIEAVAMEDANMITISVTAGTPTDAYDILQSVIKNYPKIAESVIGETELVVLDETGMPAGPMNSVGAMQEAKKGFLVGAAICVLWLAIYALTRKTLRREDDFKKLLNVTCIGSVPRVRFKKRSQTEQNKILVVNPKMAYGFNEANRVLRTRIERDAIEHGAQIYMVSSALAKEGKSTVATNLALSLATKGKKVILMDLDLRNPSIEGTLGLEKQEKGMIDVLRGRADIKDIMVQYEDTSLMVLPGGKSTQTTGRVLSDKIVGLICKELRGMADYIIVDTPPSSLLTDATHIVKHMDAGIFVVRQDYASLDSVVDGIEMLSDTGLRLVGCVFNRAETGITGHRYGYGYGYGYYGRYSRYGKYGKYGKYSKYASSSYAKEMTEDEED